MTRPEDDRARVLALLTRHGFNATSFQILEEGFRYWFDGDEACVAYADTGRAWVVAGAPIAPEADLDGVATRFIAEARARGRRACFFATEGRFVERANVDATLVGEQPVWDPAEWPAIVDRTASLREQLRRARAKGVTVRAAGAEELEDPASEVRRAMEELIVRWLASHGMAPMGFLVDVQPFAFARERRTFLAERDRRIVAFLAAVPVYARQGWFFEDLIRDPSAPNGTAELLVDFAMRAVAREGSRYATLGLAPLAGPVPGWLRALREHAKALYDFDGVRAFKAKLRPHAWEPIFLAVPRGRSENVAIYDVLAAFARGSFARFGIESLLRGPAIVVRLLAAMLIPWTALIASVDARAWFPFAWARVAWVAFDLALAASLFALAAKWRMWLGRALAIAITADAIVTAAEVCWWNAPRARGAGEWLVLAVACLAPSIAAVVLWSAMGHREIDATA